MILEDALQLPIDGRHMGGTPPAEASCPWLFSQAVCIYIPLHITDRMVPVMCQVPPLRWLPGHLSACLMPLVTCCLMQENAVECGPYDYTRSGNPTGGICWSGNLLTSRCDLHS